MSFKDVTNHIEETEDIFTNFEEHINKSTENYSQKMLREGFIAQADIDRDVKDYIEDVKNGTKIPPFKGIRAVSMKGGGMCPTQYDITDEYGQTWYVRYRGGNLSIAPRDDILNHVHRVTIGHWLDGSISAENVLLLTGFTYKGEVEL